MLRMVDPEAADISLLQLAFCQLRVTTALKHLATSTLARHTDISMSEMVVLMAAVAQPGLSQKSIAELFRQSHAAISRQMLILQDKGYITIGLDEQDKRKAVIHCTATGKAQLSQAMQAIDQELRLRLQMVDQPLIDQAINRHTQLAELLEMGQPATDDTLNGQTISRIWQEVSQY